MPKLTPFLWFDDDAEDAAQLYTSVFADAQITDTTRYTELGPLPEGTIMTVAFTLAGQDFVALNGGPEFSFTPAISFFVNCDTEDELDALWAALSEGGTVLMPLQAYPFSEKFGWLNDRFGVSWQLSLGSQPQKIVPTFLFVGDQHGHAEEAIMFYTSLFPNSHIDALQRHGADGPETEGTVQRADFTLDGQAFIALDSGLSHDFTFTPAISFVVDCATQEKVDAYWDAFADGGQEQECGWVSDRYGITWQVVPTVLTELMRSDDVEKVKHMVEAMLQMKKLDIEALRAAYDEG